MNINKQRDVWRTFWPVLLMLIVLSPPTFAQENYTEVLTTTELIGDWVLGCEKYKGEKKSCVMTQKITDRETGREVLEANIAKTKEGTHMTLVFPLGISLPEGVKLEVVGHIEKNYAFSFCTAAGCFVNKLLEPEMVELLRQKEKARMTVFPVPNKPAEVPFSIVGFLDAHRKL